MASLKDVVLSILVAWVTFPTIYNSLITYGGPALSPAADWISHAWLVHKPALVQALSLFTSWTIYLAKLVLFEVPGIPVDFVGWLAAYSTPGVWPAWLIYFDYAARLYMAYFAIRIYMGGVYAILNQGPSKIGGLWGKIKVAGHFLRSPWHHTVEWLNSGVRHIQGTGKNILYSTNESIVSGVLFDSITTSQGVYIGEFERKIQPVQIKPGAETTHKESAIPGSRYIVSDAPPSQVEIWHGDVRVGYGSRLETPKGEFLVTGSHVVKGESFKVVGHSADGIEGEISDIHFHHAVGKNCDADLAVAILTEGNWSNLRTKKAQLGITMREMQIVIYGAHEGGPVMRSHGIIAGTSDLVALGAYHTASTERGYSGAPLYAGGKITNIHLMYDAERGLNVCMSLNPLFEVRLRRSNLVRPTKETIKRWERLWRKQLEEEEAINEARRIALEKAGIVVEFHDDRYDNHDDEPSEDDAEIDRAYVPFGGADEGDTQISGKVLQGWQESIATAEDFRKGAVAAMPPTPPPKSEKSIQKSPQAPPKPPKPAKTPPEEKEEPKEEPRTTPEVHYHMHVTKESPAVPSKASQPSSGQPDMPKSTKAQKNKAKKQRQKARKLAASAEAVKVEIEKQLAASRSGSQNGTQASPKPSPATPIPQAIAKAFGEQLLRTIVENQQT